MLAGRHARRFRTYWFDTWHSDVASAVETLPEMHGCPRELYAELLQGPAPYRKKIALVLDGTGDPAAVVGLKYRTRTRDWVPITHYLVPATLFPVKTEEILLPVLWALDRDVWIAWWRMRHPPPPGRVSFIERVPTWKIPLRDDVDGLWRRSSLAKSVRYARNKCKNLSVLVDPPGAAEWVLRGWHAKWKRGLHPESSDLGDRLVVARHLMNAERYYTLLVVDGAVPAAGASMIVDGNEAVACYIYRAPDYDAYPLGTFLKDAEVRWCAGRGLEKLDLGGDYSHLKRRWGVQDGEKVHLNVCPMRLRVVRHLRLALESVRRCSRDGTIDESGE